MLTVAEIMTREPYTLGPDDSLESARQIMNAHHLRHLPVVNAQGSLIGIVSQRDVLAAEESTLLPRGTLEKDPEHFIAICDVMSSPVLSCEENGELRSAALYMQKHRVGCLPVLDRGRLCGIVTDADFVTVAINLMEQLEYSEPEEDSYEDD